MAPSLALDVIAECRRPLRILDPMSGSGTVLATAIERTRDTSICEALWCAFSRLIISKQSGASLACHIAGRTGSSNVRPQSPSASFLSAVDRVTTNCIDGRSRTRGPAAQVYEGDARHLDLLDRSIDLVITSPPYLNAIDYLRCSKFSLAWMGYSVSELRRLRSTAVGTEVGMDARDDQEIQRILSDLKLQPKLHARQEAMLARYINDIQRAVSETSRVLAGDGRAVYVVGENTVRGTFICNAMIVEAVASTAGLRCTARRSQELPANRRYLPPPSKQSETATLGNRLRREVILTFRKVA